MRQTLIEIREAIKLFLSRLSFRTGVFLLAMCVVFHILAFAQALLPYSAGTKAIVGIALIGVAKTTQYSGLAIVGTKGWQRIKGWFKLKKSNDTPDTK